MEDLRECSKWKVVAEEVLSREYPSPNARVRRSLIYRTLEEKSPCLHANTEKSNYKLSFKSV